MSKLEVSRQAGAIHYLLENRNVLSISEIAQLTNYLENHILLALGWLARDNRIVIVNKNDNLYVRLNCYPLTEVHYR